jgi:ABC-type lipoprotein export system ATPase subunit
VVVTHDEKLAGSARRVVHMLDGRVVRDEPLLRRA